MSAERESVAQRRPAVPLTGFPAYSLVPSYPVYRAHAVTRAPWWFSSSEEGRFDLPKPRGTCYLAGSPLAALRERIGSVLGERAFVPASLLEGVVVSKLSVLRPISLADLQAHRASDFGVTRELETMTPYAVPHAWALAFAGAGCGGVRYRPRFTTGTDSSYAVFGRGGEQDWPLDPEPVPATEVSGAPVALEPPRRMDLTVVRTPRTRTR